MNPPESKAAFPAGLGNVFVIAVLNALSFQIVLSSPMVLYAKTLGASATVLGIIAGMMPLLVIFQIPAAQYISRVGYKQFVYAGWGVRVMFIFAMALVPLTGGFLNTTTQLVLILALLFCFNLSRGISSAAWLPWITALVPAALRGKYLSVEAAFVNLASFVALLVSALWLGGRAQAWQFAALFGFSAVMGVGSLVFLKRIPEGASPEPGSASGAPVPWRAIAGFAPFRRLLRVVFAWSLAYGGLTVFTVAWLKTEAGLTEGRILLMTSVTFLGGLSSLWLLGARLDQFGSKPVLTFSFALCLLLLAGWAALAGGAWAPGLFIILPLQLFLGLCNALVSMANTRLVMAIVPVMGRNHFFALYSVVGSLTLGLAPVLWGLLIDVLAPVRIAGPGFEWNRYSIFFAAAGAVFAVALALCRQLEEPEAASTEKLLKEILIDSPQRAWLRLWLRG